VKRAEPEAAGTLAVFAAAGVAVGLWAGTPIVTKIAVAEIEPVLVGMLRTVLPAFISIPLALALRIGLPAGWRHWGWLLVSALAGFVLFPILFTVGIRYTSASHAGLILAILPVFTGLMASGLERRWPGPLWWLGVAVAGAGTAALVGLRLGFAGGADSLLGDLVILAGGLCASAGYVSGARLSQLGYSAWGTTFWGLAVGGLVLLPFLAIAAPSVDWGAVSMASWLCVAYLMLASSILGYVAWYWALARGGIGRVGLMQFAQPVGTLVLAALMLGEALTVPLVIVAVVILGGIYIARRGA
jgi:drug/metabolite transporter (DMT)-like permease